jgi:CBS domain-containing protein
VRDSPLLQPEALTSVHAIDEDGSLRGVARLVTLIQADPADRVIDVSDTDPVRVGPDADITDVAVLMTDYNLITIPVVDDRCRLLGVITVDDVLEITLPEDWRRREAADPSLTSLRPPAHYALGVPQRTFLRTRCATERVRTRARDLSVTWPYPARSDRCPPGGHVPRSVYSKHHSDHST